MLSSIEDIPVSINEQWREAAPEALPLSLRSKETLEQAPWIAAFLLQLKDAVGEDAGLAAEEHHNRQSGAVVGGNEMGECSLLCHVLTVKRRWQVVCCM